MVNLLFGLIFIILFFNALYLLVFAISGKLKTAKIPAVDNAVNRIAVLIPAYKEDAVILDSAQQALTQDYPAELMEIVVIADSLQPDTISQLKALSVTVIGVAFENSTKAKSLNAALNFLDENFDIAVILDADNVMAPNFLRRVDTTFQGGCSVAQGHRVAKNTDTPFARLDAVSEEINNHIFRKGHRALGLSAALIGSGMAFDFRVFKKFMAVATAVGGFDKELELNLLKAGVQIEYLEDALVYDEKVRHGDVFQTQRRRWLSAQVFYFQQHFKAACKALFDSGNVDYFDKAVQMVLLPRVLQLGLATVFLILGVLPFRPGLFAWQLIWLMTVIALALAMPRYLWNWETLQAALHVPAAFWRMLKSVAGIRGANKKFIHTPHSNKN